MMTRNDALQAVLDAAFVAFDRHTQDVHARLSILQIFSNLEAPQTFRRDIGKRLPVCKRYLDGVLRFSSRQAVLDRLVEAFAVLEPMLEWKYRSIYDS